MHEWDYEEIDREIRSLAEDADRPIHVEGDVWVPDRNGGEYFDMDPREARQAIIKAVIDHHSVATAIAEREKFWEALKWTMAHAKLPKDIPPQHAEVFIAAGHAQILDNELPDV